MGRILVAGAPGTEIVDALAPLANETVIDKPGKGAFYATALHELLRSSSVSQLVVAGVTTEVCVQSTMREANDRGYECLLATDATASYFPAFKASTIDMLCSQGGIVGWATTTANVTQALHA